MNIPMNIFIPIVAAATIGLIVLAVRMHKEAMKHIAELQFFLNQRTIVQNQAKAKLAVLKSRYDGLEKDYRTLQIERKELKALQEENKQYKTQQVIYKNLEKEFEMLQAEKLQYEKIEKEFQVLQADISEFDKIAEENKRLKVEMFNFEKLTKENKALKSEVSQMEVLERDYKNLQSEMVRFGNIQSDLDSLKIEMQELERLEKENKNLRAELQQYQNLEKENRILRSEMLGLEKLEKENKQLKLELYEQREKASAPASTAPVVNTFLEKRRAQIDRQLDNSVVEPVRATFVDFKKSRYTEERASFAMMEKKSEIEKLEGEIAAIQKILNGEIKEQLMSYMNEVDLLNQKLNSARKDFNSHLANRAFESLDIKDVA